MIQLQGFSEERVAREYPWADRFAMGLPLAPWQRDFVWTPGQCERFVTSAWTGVYLGTYIVTSMELREEGPDIRGIEYLPLSSCVIDGQQRLKALELYLTDQLAVPDEEGKLTLWSEVEPNDQRRFKSTIFNRGEIRVHDEDALRRVYGLLNFGGVPHQAHERALPVERAQARMGCRP